MISIPDCAILSVDEKRQLTAIAEELSEIPEVNAIILFGFRAGGRPKPYSDIDICVITMDCPKRSDKEEIGSFSARNVDLSIFDDLPVFVRFSVFQSGSVIFLRDKSRLNELKVKTLLQYHDFQPFLERFAKRRAGVLE
ncbi:nucleotidyltransferase domain-containing protein [Methanoplanus endosymbiosus]|uniref:Nucleotidyltransferase domain-containing protein n=1 Tax=Methanoplanus endosymbiosus TaxID=33865 RepID=A0A9E7TIZ8_9EURY|nr:nucleotidyltransferase domain-containing protein [Methanoplanus endosymbiosus]UUX91364.1 nucleotidyltransferase domain-containing protein [Methanoplanus endosymbiosus]